MHLLATDTATLDEVETAVDLEQSPADIVVLSFSDSDLSALAAAWGQDRNQDRENLPILRLASLKRLRHPMSVDLYIETVIAGSRLVIIRSIGGLDYWRYGFESVAASCAKHGILLVALPGDDRPDPRLAKLCTAPEEAVAAFDAYFRQGGTENFGNALRLGATLLGREAEVAPPVPLGPAIGMHADGSMAAAAELTPADPGRPVALIVFYRASLLAADTAPIIALMDALTGEGMSPLALAVTSLKDRHAGAEIEALIGRAKPSVVLNATAFSARREDDTTVLDAADCPVLQVAMAGSAFEAWDDSLRGLSPSDLAMNVVLPELDGRLFTRTISFKEEREADPALQYSATLHGPAMDRIAYVAKLAASWARLRETPREDRRLALMISDYPARGGRTGYACGLDTPESVASIVRLLREAGYATGDADWPAEEIIPRLTDRASEDMLRVPLSAYRAWTVAHPENVAAITEAWGPVEDDPQFDGEAFRFPCLRAGNLLVLLQPDRGSFSDRSQGYHDPTCPPRHSYAALYSALREAEKIDALIHLGTHGTLEWLPGKALALSKSCFPEALLGPVPVIYPFIVNNPGEAVQAKRRISAATIGHLTPPLSEAGLHGTMAELEGLIEEYAEAEGVDRRRVPLLEAEILEVAWRTGMAADCGVTKDDAPREAIAKLDAQLCDIKDLAIRDRLHVFGQAPESNARGDLAAAALASLAESNTPATKEWIETLLGECAGAERDGLLAALDGRRVAPGPAGAPTRGRLDVLPTGRNLTTIDPRSIPTRIAARIGARAADDVVRRHLQDHGDYPRALMLDLWASASLRTGGDDLAQAFAYLGVTPTWDGGSNRVTGIEVLPIAKLERPRIDVTLRISGLFRDIFPAQIALFDMAVRKVTERDEDEEWNPLAAARQRGESLSRIFGGAPGSYGAGMTDLALDGVWEARGDLAEAYLRAGSYAYGPQHEGVAARDAFEARIAEADALVHPQDDRERDLLDGDGIADFVGGFAAAAASLSEKSPALYHLDTSKPETPVTRTLNEEITRIVRGRLTNPRWIAGMLEHGHRGVAEMAQAVDALYAFAAGTEAVPGHLFDAVHEALIADEAVCAAIRAANPDALHAMTARLDDLLARGLWTPKRNAVHGELAQARLQLGGANFGRAAE
ncbi:cobaltochelatase subunit CobN [Methyloligella sp. 2.7D]|uniref:cobaltochelatase subunit CobN n=1 Tax=unclassified Methyloligella TaxID=2625955 RepID=UPI00157E1CE2|nr:cobaltochelatase subunit CobN [Methyloligella sp. GL2]QKP78176.1 cobaltochelatase subunit CobN [Methyloligella sp. GL2]